MLLLVSAFFGPNNLTAYQAGLFRVIAQNFGAVWDRSISMRDALPACVPEFISLFPSSGTLAYPGDGWYLREMATEPYRKNSGETPVSVRSDGTGRVRLAKKKEFFKLPSYAILWLLL